MSVSNKSLKIKLHALNPHCHWCGRETILTNFKEIRGQPNPLMATIDHLVSRYFPERWITAKPGEVRKVLACFECNNKRASEETKKLHPFELYKRGQGYSLNPRGKPAIGGTVETIEEFYAKLEEHGIEVMQLNKPDKCENNPRKCLTFLE